MKSTKIHKINPQDMLYTPMEQIKYKNRFMVRKV